MTDVISRIFEVLYLNMVIPQIDVQAVATVWTYVCTVTTVQTDFAGS